MVLLREFRLHGLFFGFLLVAALWIWRNSQSFIPAYANGSISEIVQGKTAREGVVHLLQRNIPADQLPEVCLAEWRKSHPHLDEFDSARYHQAKDFLDAYRERPRKERDPIQTYQELTSILSK